MNTGIDQAALAESGHQAPDGSLWQLPLLLVALLTLSAAVMFLPQQTWQDDRLTVSLAGEHYRVSPAEIGMLESLTRRHFTEGEARAQAQLQATVANHLDVFFASAETRIPDFLDWYYSLSAEYTRVAMAALGWAGLSEGDYLAREAAQRLLPDVEWQRQNAVLQTELLQVLDDEQVAIREGWLAEMMTLLADRRVPGPIDTLTESRPAMVLDDVTTQWFDRESEALRMRMQASTLSGVVAVAALRQAAARGAAARVAGRSMARAGSAGLSAAAACAPGGFIAAGCAVVVGAGTWVLGDMLLLRVDEARNREAMTEQLILSLQQLRDATETELLAVYGASLDAHHDASRQQITDSFQPLRASGAQGSAAGPAGSSRR